MIRTVLFAALLAAPLSLSAQSLPDWAAPGAAGTHEEPPTDLVPDPPDPPAGVPIDGGLALLALAGAGLAARRLRS